MNAKKANIGGGNRMASKAGFKIGSMLDTARKSVKQVAKAGGLTNLASSKKKSGAQWRAEKSEIFFCDNNHDNFPEKSTWGDYTFYISQNRDENKKEGQDCMGIARHKDYECVVLCDGHDQDGFKVATGVCQNLPNIILRRIHLRSAEKLYEPVEDELIYDAFDECENTVCWTGPDLKQGEFVKIKGGDFDNVIGYIGGIDSDDEINVVIDSQSRGYHRLVLPPERLSSSKYHGGCTCVCIIRNLKRNHCRIATLGDSRFMVAGDILKVTESGKKTRDFDDPVLMTTFLEDEDTGDDFLGYFTPQHNVYNADERDRLEASKNSEDTNYGIDLEYGYLINPETKFQIQPTRGFGDMEMYGTGYTQKPELSCTFKISKNTLLMAASDGIFDGEVWEDDEELLHFTYNLRQNGFNAAECSSAIYKESLQRCLLNRIVDDISMFLYYPEPVSAKLQRTQSALKRKNSRKMVKKKRSMQNIIIKRKGDR